MGKKILLGWLVLTFLLLSINAQAENVVYLDYISVNTPKNDVIRYWQLGSNKAPAHVNSPSMDIQHVYLSVDGMNLTMKMEMGGPAIVNSSITSEIFTYFNYNSTFQVDIDAFKGQGISYQTVTLNKNQTKLTAIQLYSVTYHTDIHTGGSYVYWNIDLAGLNKFIPINKVFIKHTFFNEIQPKYKIHPRILGYILNTHVPKTSNISDYVIKDNFTLTQTSPSAISNYFWPILITSIVLVIAIIALIIRKILKKSGKNGV